MDISDTTNSIRKLHPEHTALLQRLFERCPDYAMIVEGEEVSPEAAKETFEAAPPGRSLADKFIYGLFDRQGELRAVLEGMRHYPENGVWWIGLLMIDPALRGQGVGKRLVQFFCDCVRSQRGEAVMLGVVEENAPAFQFWQKQGFAVVRKTEPRPFGKKVQSVFVMLKLLTGEPPLPGASDCVDAPQAAADLEDLMQRTNYAQPGKTFTRDEMNEH